MPSVTCELSGAVAVLTLCNADKRNALDGAMCAALAGHLDQLHEHARAAILTGDGDGAFSAGFDITELSAELQGDDQKHPFEQLMAAVARCPVPLIAAMRGVAHGGGLELAASCDVRIAHATVRMAMPPAKLGIVYRTPGLARFAALLGEGRARELFLTARSFTGEEAAAWGLVQRLVAEEAVLATAHAVAEEIAALPSAAVQGTRVAFEALLRRRAELQGDDGVEVERRRAAAWSSADAEAARRRFLTRR